MATGGQKRTRLERVAALELPPGQWERFWALLFRRNVLARLGVALLASVALTLVIRGWNPPFSYQVGYAPSSDIVATASFSRPDDTATEDAQDLARSRVRCVFVQDPASLVELRALLRSRVGEITAATRLSEVHPQHWQEFETVSSGNDPSPTKEQEEEQFASFRQALNTPQKLAKFEKDLALALAPFETRGLMTKFPRDPSKANFDDIKANFEEIDVYPVGSPDKYVTYKVADVLLGDGKALSESLRKQFDNPEVADHVFAWLRPRLRDTLALDDVQTKRRMDEAAAAVGEVVVKVSKGHTLAQAGVPLNHRHVKVLRLEYEAAMAQRSWQQRVARATALSLTFFGLFVLCGAYIRYRDRTFASLKNWTSLLVLTVFTAAVGVIASADAWRAEIIPVLLAGMIVSIAFRQELALLLCGVLSAILALATGEGLTEFIALTGICTTAILQMGQIRTRAKLIYVGLVSGLVAFVLQLVASVLDNQPLDMLLVTNAVRTGVWTLVTGFLMTGLLPFVENGFGVLTDLSLLELGDVAHPLLQELIRRAPATYNHSITVGSIAEAAAEAIGCRGLLVRVGAYFHDIGKMLKPGYFIENQAVGVTPHESLMPTMSTLVIIAHVKDGADLGRQRHLPRPIIDLIEQHHGTMLLEYFYGRATQQSDLTGEEVDEQIYRYPGPKPQTKEAGVLMLADAVEGASRALVDPTPARIENLVQQLAERRLQDGQFDESGLTLRELRAIQRSLVKSLTALYHGRIKYPEQRSA